MYSRKLASWGLGFKLPIVYGNLFSLLFFTLYTGALSCFVKTVYSQTKWKWKLGPVLKHPLPACPLHNAGLSVAFSHVSFRSEPHLFIVSYMSLHSSAVHAWPLVVRPSSRHVLHPNKVALVHCMPCSPHTEQTREQSLHYHWGLQSGSQRLACVGLQWDNHRQTDRHVAFFLCHMSLRYSVFSINSLWLCRALRWELSCKVNFGSHFLECLSLRVLWGAGGLSCIVRSHYGIGSETYSHFPRSFFLMHISVLVFFTTFIFKNARPR